MSKRQAQFQGGEERYGGVAPEEMSDRPQQATAAQLAKRKIAQAKGTRRPRSESPMPGGGSIYDQATQNGFLSNNSSSMPPSNPFASAGGFTFGNNANGSSQSFGSGGGSFTFGGGSGQQTQQSTPNTNTSFQFGNQPSGSFTFGSPAPPTNGFGGSTTPFGGFGQSNGGFGDSTPKATTPAIFEDNPTPKPSNPFGAAQPTTNLFGGATTNGTSSNTGSTGFNFTSNNTFGQKAPETSQASSTTFGGFSAPNTQPEKPASDGWNSFVSATKPAEKPTTNGFTPSTTSLFGSTQTNVATTNGSAAPSIFAGLSAASKTPTGFQFSAQPADNDASMMSPENTPQKPNGVASEQAPSQAGKSLFERITRSPPKENAQPAPSLFGGALPPAAPKTNLFPSQSAEKPSASAAPKISLFGAPSSTTPAPSAAAPSTSTPAAPKAQTSMQSTKPEHFNSFRELNESLMQHLKSQDLSKDLTSIFKFYQTAAEGIVKGATASKPSEPLYPKLPETASNTAKMFQAALDTPAAASTNSLFSSKPSTFTPSTTSLFSSKPAESAPTTSLFSSKSVDSAPASTSLFAPKPAEPAPATEPAPSLFGAKPAAPATNGFTPSTTSLFAPKLAEPATGGFKPTTAGTGSSFLSSFGAAAAKNEEKEKKRRREEDFDSDEDDAAEWEKKDAEEQAAKRKKIEEAAKSGSGFSFKPTSDGTAKPSLFAGVAKPAETDKSDTGDHTWKQGTPIKFGGNTTTSTTPAAPKFSLFGAANPAASSNGPSLFGATPAAASSNGPSLFAGAAKPASTFSFGQPSAAPAVSTPPTESTEQPEEGDAAPPEQQLDDLAILLPAEKEENDVLLSIPLSKSRKLESRPSEGGTEKPTWVDKGKGPIWILRNKATGKTRVLQKIQDSGRAAMNFSLLKGDSFYKHEGMNGKSVMATFIDHIGKDASKPSKWAIIVGKQEDAAEIARILKEEQAKI